VQNWIGLTVAQVLSLCGTPYRDVTMVDEPPGKLQAVEFECRQNANAGRVVLELEYHPALFSAARAWTEETVAKQKVIAVRRPTRGGH
jgi:hypothetical protein